MSFIYCAKRELKAEDEFMVIKVLMPAGDASQIEGSDVPGLERAQVESIRCQVSEAHAPITDLIKGKKKWRELPVDTWITSLVSKVPEVTYPITSW